MIRLSIANLAGVPSIIFGLFGLTFFCIFLGLGVSLVSGVLTLALLSLPIIINTTEAALLQISAGMARKQVLRLVRRAARRFSKLRFRTLFPVF